MIKSLSVFFFLLISTLCSSYTFPIFDYVDRSDLIIQGEIIHIDQYSGEVTVENMMSVKDTAYILIQKIFKTNSDKTSLNENDIKLIIPAKNRTTKDGINIYSPQIFSNQNFYKIGRSGIWFLKEKDGSYYNFYNQSTKLSSKGNLIQKLCKIDPQVLDFLNSVFWLNNSKVNHYFELANIDPTDSIYFYSETNPIFIAVRQRKNNLIQVLIDYGFNLNFKNENDENALFIAVKRLTDDLGIIEILLKNDIETDIMNKEGVSIYDLVHKKKNKEEILELFQKHKE